MKRTKTFLSCIVAMTMVFASIASVSAADDSSEQNTEGRGAAEGYVNKNVRDVVVPTNALDFIVDPQGLIKASGSNTTKYKNFTFNNKTKEGEDKDDGFVYFTNTKTVNGKTTTEKASYADIVVENKSSYKVSITPKIAYTDGKVGKTSMGCTATVNQATTTALKSNLLFNLYLKEVATTTDADGNQTTGTGFDYTLINGKKDGKAVVPNTLEGIEAYYATTYDATKGYTYALATAGTNVYSKLTDVQKAQLGNTVTYTLEGISNVNATNWDAVVTKMNQESTEEVVVVQPSLKITWTITDIK